MHAVSQVLPNNAPVKFLALGDSYTVGEGVAVDQRWPVQLVNALMLKGYTCHRPHVLAVTGWRTDELFHALLESGQPRDFSLVSLLIGVNNQYQGKSIPDFKKEFEKLLDLAIAHAGGKKDRVFVLSIPDYGYTPFGVAKQLEISKEIDAFNQVKEGVCSERGVHFINITDLSRQGMADPSLLADDGLHPSGKMYALWVERILGSLL